MWQQRLAEYREAKARDDEAKRLMSRAERTADKLAKRIGDKRAYEIAGVNLADVRSLRTYQDLDVATKALMESLRGATVPARIKGMVPSVVPICPALQTTAEACNTGPPHPGGLFCRLLTSCLQSPYPHHLKFALSH